MAARPDDLLVQEHGCHILARVADYKPSFGETVSFYIISPIASHIPEIIV
jgi:hypothetical protein